jgi:hypothetical protein
MILFSCEVCGHQLYFESTECVRCRSTLGFLSEQQSLTTLSNVDTRAAGPQAAFRVGDSGAKGQLFRKCRNWEQHEACNWLVPVDGDAGYCASCALTEIVPDLSNNHNKRAWLELEAAKRRLLFTLKTLKLPVLSKAESEDHGLAFRFLRNTPDEPVVTGHNAGIITVNVAEADAAYRENQRERLGEAYRTTLGHLRHEIGHYYFDLLITQTPRESAFRDLFGDERASYEAAITRHYDEGPPADWANAFISGYATMHPWEDWAESWAHYLHMVDVVQTAKSYGLVVREPSHDGRGPQLAMRDVDADDFAELGQGFYLVTLAMNGLNRSMGLKDAYPFTVAEHAQRKLAFIHDAIRAAAV